MIRLLRHLLLVVALLFSQHAAMLHGLAHAGHEIAVAESSKGNAPALDHGADVCAAFGAIAHALGDFPVVSIAAGVDAAVLTTLPPTLAVPARIVFDSRAPPASA